MSTLEAAPPEHPGKSRLEFVESKIDESPPISSDSIDPTVNHPSAVREALANEIGLSYAVEVEVARNVKELDHLFPDMPKADQVFIRDLWEPHELAHGEGLSLFMDAAGMEEPPVELDRIGGKIRILGYLGRAAVFSDIERLMYYLTGAATEKAAVSLYGSMGDKLKDLDEPDFEHFVRRIGQQEPIHNAFYTMSGRELAAQLSPWQLYVARILRSHSFALVGTSRPERKPTMGRIIENSIGSSPQAIGKFAAKIAALDKQLLWAGDQGMRIPPYVTKAIRECLERAHEEDGVYELYP